MSRAAQPLLVPYLPRQGKSVGQLDLMIRRRGLQRFSHAHVSSLFPFGFFRKGVRYPVDLELLVYPELFPAAAAGQPGAAPIRTGADAGRRAGWGHGIYALRAFRQGDDPRGIHWKQTARTGAIVYMERDSEHSRRLSILFDNAVGELDGEEADGALRAAGQRGRHRRASTTSPAATRSSW